MNAMNGYANSAEAPDFDAPTIMRRTRRRRTVGIAAVATGLILAGGGTALATSAGGSHASQPSSTVTKNDATTMLWDDHGVTITIDFSGRDLVLAKQVLLKTQTKLGTVTKKAVKNCKPGSVVGVSPHTPKIVKSGDTVDLTLCSG
ncbi:hypothetical protein [Streptomyces sp. NPDC050759]|uniref:hypothetical protein n=1 Tax=Streptomyces sp. NPDC050759 TaxID=3365635 RepID=UPI0037A4064C